MRVCVCVRVRVGMQDLDPKKDDCGEIWLLFFDFFDPDDDERWRKKKRVALSCFLRGGRRCGVCVSEEKGDGKKRLPLFPFSCELVEWGGGIGVVSARSTNICMPIVLGMFALQKGVPSHQRKKMGKIISTRHSPLQKPVNTWCKAQLGTKWKIDTSRLREWREKVLFFFSGGVM